MKLRSRAATPPPRIEIIPLIDIMFFLLATFVMVSTAMIKNKGIRVQLPVAESAAKESRKDYVSVTISEAGEYYLDQERVDAPVLEAKLQELKANNPDPKVFLNGDKHAQLQQLVSALDAVRKVGITKIALETKE